MEVLVGIVILLVVDWRLNKIHKELQRLNELMGRSLDSVNLKGTQS